MLYYVIITSKEVTMNFSIYIPDKLGAKLNTIAAQKHISKNYIVREALEDWLKAHPHKMWPSGFFSFEGLSEVPDFKSYRSELKDPKEDIL
jgi:cAMP phosphodiesterase